MKHVKPTSEVYFKPLKSEELTHLSGGYAPKKTSSPTENLPTIEDILDFKWY